MSRARPMINFTEEENHVREALMACWKGDLREEGFYMDGFYPKYDKQQLKILFVGREAWGDIGDDYITFVGNGLIKDVRDGGWNVNQYPFHRRQFYISYGILTACQRISQNPALQDKNDWRDVFLPWDNIPFAEELKTIFAQQGNVSVGELNSISWAFMNLSKIANKSGGWQTDYEAYNQFIKDHVEEIKKEVDILKPDLIIGANVHKLVELLQYDKIDEVSDANCFYYAKASGITPPMVNCYHFAATKNERVCFYESVMKILWKHKAEWIGKIKK